MWVQKKENRVAQKSKCGENLHMHNQRRARPSLHLLAPDGNIDLTLSLWVNLKQRCRQV
jgi:hypothetical protein